MLAPTVNLDDPMEARKYEAGLTLDQHILHCAY